MTDQLTTARPPARNAPSPARHRRIRTAATIAGVAALIATGGYVATTTIHPDAAAPTADTGTDINPSAQTLRELHRASPASMARPVDAHTRPDSPEAAAARPPAQT